MTDFLPSIRAYFAQPDARGIQPKELARLLRIRGANTAPFFAAITHLVEAGELRRAANGKLIRGKHAEAQEVLTGKYRRTTSGSGYFMPEGSAPEDEAIFIAPADQAGALNGDVVTVSLLRHRRTGGQRCGRVVEILSRRKTTFVGVYHEKRNRGYVTLDGGLIDAPVFVGDPGAKGARPDDKVVIEILHFPTATEPAEGVITQVLGARGAPGVDCLAVIHEFDLPDAFPERVLENAREQARRYSEHDLQDRLDLTNETIVTIDPIDARDFDDAISLERRADGSWRLGVHIADVAFFVQPGSPLDHEAQKRGNSVYLPDRVLPMLPEILSNALSSLQQDHVRYTKTAFIEFTPDGIPTHSELANSAIRVKRRFAYEQVMPILHDPEAHRDELGDEVLSLLQRMHTLAMMLRKRRFAQGALDLQLPEVKVDFHPDGAVAGAHYTVHDESHQLIEEFMLAANIAVAQQLAKKGWPYLSRTHAAPDEKKLKALGEFVKSLGFEVKPWAGRKEIQRLLEAVRGQPAEYAISYATLRSLKQAEYSPAEIGHFALNEQHYCHFTSPIRRYPDLTIHRLIDELVREADPPHVPSVGELVQLGEQCSSTERRAEQAERELIKIKLLTFLKDRIGWEQEATITGIERFGIFCQGLELPAEGLAPVRTLPIDHYEYDNRAHTLTGRRRGNMYRLGDRVMVRVAAVDLHKRLLEYKIVPRNSHKRTVDSRKPDKPEQRA